MWEIFAAEVLGLALVLWFLIRHRDTQRKRATCPHLNFYYASLDNRGVRWRWCCDDCGLQYPYRVTIPARAHPDNPLCVRHAGGRCECLLECIEDRSREGV